MGGILGLSFRILGPGKILSRSNDVRPSVRLSVESTIEVAPERKAKLGTNIHLILGLFGIENEQNRFIITEVMDQKPIKIHHFEAF